MAHTITLNINTSIMQQSFSFESSHQPHLWNLTGSPKNCSLLKVAEIYSVVSICLYYPLKSQITTAAEDIHLHFFIVFHRK